MPANVTWLTPQGVLATLSNFQPVGINFSSYEDPPATITYELVSGSLPSGLALLSNGYIYGTTSQVNVVTSNSFLVYAAGANSVTAGTFSFLQKPITETIWQSPSNNSVQTVVLSSSNVNIPLIASASYASFTNYTSRTLPDGVSIIGNRLIGLVTGNTNLINNVSIITASTSGNTIQSNLYINWNLNTYTGLIGTLSLLANVASANENSTVIFTVTDSTNSNSNILWRAGVFGPTGADNTSNNLLFPFTGTVRLINGSGTFPVYIKEDKLTSGARTLTASLLNSINQIISSNTIIINDTSTDGGAPCYQALYTTAGSYLFVSPITGVVHVVAVGGGGGGLSGGSWGGGGGSLGWKNNIPVIAGCCYAVCVGAGGGQAVPGGTSFFIANACVSGGGGAFAGTGGMFVGDGGGVGGQAGLGNPPGPTGGGGGGGAGGYIGNGGNGAIGVCTFGQPTAGCGGGGGGGGTGWYPYDGKYGGGVELCGLGPNGTAGVSCNNATPPIAGGGGSGGVTAGYGAGGWGGSAGGGPGAFGGGASGGVRIIWGNRCFPNIGFLGNNYFYFNNTSATATFTSNSIINIAINALTTSTITYGTTGNFPSFANINPANGRITGITNFNVTDTYYNFGITASDANGSVITLPYSIGVLGRPILITAPSNNSVFSIYTGKSNVEIPIVSRSELTSNIILYSSTLPDGMTLKTNSAIPGSAYITGRPTGGVSNLLPGNVSIINATIANNTSLISNIQINWNIYPLTETDFFITSPDFVDRGISINGVNSNAIYRFTVNTGNIYNGNLLYWRVNPIDGNIISPNVGRIKNIILNSNSFSGEALISDGQANGNIFLVGNNDFSLNSDFLDFSISRSNLIINRNAAVSDGKYIVVKNLFANVTSLTSNANILYLITFNSAFGGANTGNTILFTVNTTGFDPGSSIFWNAVAYESNGDIKPNQFVNSIPSLKGNAYGEFIINAVPPLGAGPGLGNSSIGLNVKNDDIFNTVGTNVVFSISTSNLITNPTASCLANLSATLCDGGLMETLIVGGGGGGGSAGGGGGGGGFVALNRIISFNTSTCYVVSVGAGGASSTCGSQSNVFGLIALGGGNGGDVNSNNAGTGGSGGGGPGAGTGPVGCGKPSVQFSTYGYGQGCCGGNGFRFGSGDPTNYVTAGGGGGALGPGGSPAAFNSPGGAGGTGAYSCIRGSNVAYGGGGGGTGSLQNSPGGAGGAGGGGGGGSNSNGAPGTPNTGGGGGGGGGWGSPGGSPAPGGSGIVVLKYSCRWGTGSVVGSPNLLILGSDIIYTFCGTGAWIS